MARFAALLALVALLGIAECRNVKDGQPSLRAAEGETPDGSEKWGYVDVRTNVHMFYWLYYTYHADGFANRPWILWLQGGPGASSCGYGNFEIIGPLDLDLNPRNTTWVKQASILFVDNPVGAGYSYVDDSSAYTRDVAEITSDLVEVLRAVLVRAPEFATRPLYVFGQSYGGKMGAHFSRYLYNEIQLGNINVNLAGFAMGNSWISPIDSTTTWGPLLYWMSATDDQGMQAIQAEAQLCRDAVDAGEWVLATQYWSSTEGVVIRVTNGIDFYNILKYEDYGFTRRSTDEFRIAHKVQQLKQKGLNPGEKQFPKAEPKADDPLDALMNGPIREKLAIIPANVTWGSQSDAVFFFQEGDFMKPVVDVVDDALQNTTLQVIIYQGQLDLICDTKAAMDFVQQFKWTNLTNYNTNDHKAFESPADGQTESFVKAHDRFKFYWILLAGHAVPKDQGDRAYRMLDRILNDLDK
jgi:serine carboxypeptidase 1